MYSKCRFYFLEKKTAPLIKRRHFLTFFYISVVSFHVFLQLSYVKFCLNFGMLVVNVALRGGEINEVLFLVFFS